MINFTDELFGPFVVFFLPIKVIMDDIDIRLYTRIQSETETHVDSLTYHGFEEDSLPAASSS